MFTHVLGVYQGFEVGKVEVPFTPREGIFVPFRQRFTDPVVIAQVMDSLSPNWSAAWVSGQTVTTQITPEGIKLTLLVLTC